MAKFVIHKRGFFYTDEAFELVDGVEGSIVGTFDNLEEAKLEKEKQDILSIQNLRGMYVADFFCYNDNYDEVYKQLEDFYRSDFTLSEEEENYFVFPENVSDEQAKRFLEILVLTFHDIVQYDDETELNSEDFNLEEMDLNEF